MSAIVNADRRLSAITGHLHPSIPASSTHPSPASLLPPLASHSTATPPPDLNSPIPLSEEATMYSSRQIPLFSPKLAEQGEGQKTIPVSIDQIKLHVVPRLSEYPIKSQLSWYDNFFQRTKAGRVKHKPQSPSSSSSSSPAPSGSELVRNTDTLAKPTLHANELVTYNQLIHDDELVMLDIVRRPHLSKSAKAFVRAGPRAKICWAEGEVVAAIVTCGGLCPGLNDVIAELFHTLYYGYGVDHIYGIRSGFRGFHEPSYSPWRELTPEKVRGIYELGGTVLGSSRGGFDIDKILNACQQKRVNQIYIIGGDGTHRAANALYLETRKRGLKMTVAGIPKTIDNDIGVIDRSFGFNTAVAEARKAIQSAVVEASCAPRGLGIVQLMGRHAGYISAHATLASRQVDLCLIPEVPFPLHGELGVLRLVEQIIDRQGYGVIVVAEGAGGDLLKDTGETDESGNAKLPEIGKYLQQQIQHHFKQLKKDVSIKYHDPSYMIRSVPADAGDSVFAMTLAQNAVHGCMAGYTGFTSGLVNNRTVMLPIPAITVTSPSYLNPDGRTWERVVSLTHQPMWERVKDRAVAGGKDDKKDDKKEEKKAGGGGKEVAKKKGGK